MTDVQIALARLAEARTAAANALLAEAPLQRTELQPFSDPAPDFSYAATFQDIGKSVLGQVGSFVLGRALNAIFKDPDQGRLAAIQSELGTISRQISNLETQLENLTSRLELRLSELTAKLEQAGLRTSIAAIEETQAALARLNERAIDPNRTNPDDEDLKAFQSTMMMRDLPVQVREVGNAAVDSVGFPDGLLLAWTNVLIDSLPATQEQLAGAAEVLEMLFLQLLHLQFMGIALHISGLTAGLPADEPSDDAELYLNDARALMARQFDRYARMVERLAARAVDVDATDASPPLGPMAAALDRVDLLRLLVLDEPEGIRGRLMVLPSAGQGPSLQPSPVFPERAGVLRPEWSDDRALWPRGFELRDGVVTDPEESLARFVDYRWDWPDERPEVGVPLPNSTLVTPDGTSIQVVPRWVDPTTLQFVEEQVEGAILYASFLETSPAFPDMSGLDWIPVGLNSASSTEFSTGPLIVEQRKMSNAPRNSTDRFGGAVKLSIADGASTTRELVVTGEVAVAFVADHVASRLNGAGRTASMTVLTSALSLFPIPGIPGIPGIPSGNLFERTVASVSNPLKGDQKELIDMGLSFTIRTMVPPNEFELAFLTKLVVRKGGGASGTPTVIGRLPYLVRFELHRLRLAWS